MKRLLIKDELLSLENNVNHIFLLGTLALAQSTGYSGCSKRINMSKQICIRLPYLHKNFTQDIPDNFRLCPCQDDPEALPINWPLNQEKSAQFLRQLKNMNVRDLDSLRHFFNRRAIALDYAFADEMQVLSRFVQDDLTSDQPSLDKNKARTKIIEQAQQTLLWCWHMEELAIEIADLERKCGAMENKLRQNFLERSEEFEGFSSAATQHLLPPWRICAANAIFFLPDNAYVYMEGIMRADLLENFTFQQSRNPDFDELLEFRAPLWKILGHSRNNFSISGSASSLLEEAYGRERIWLTRRDA